MMTPPMLGGQLFPSVQTHCCSWKLMLSVVFSRQVSCCLPPANLREVKFRGSVQYFFNDNTSHARAVTDDCLGAVAVDVDLPIAVAFHHQRV